MFKFARNILSALQGKRSLDASDSEEETERPDLKRNKSEDIAAATNSGSPDVADSATAGVRSETAAAPKFNYVLKAKNLPQGNVKPTKKYFADLGFSRIDKIPSKDFATITFDSEEKALAAQKTLDGLMFQQKYKIETEILKRKVKEFKPKERKVVDDTRTPYEKLADQVTPLHKLSYQEQLNKKHQTNINHLSNIKKQLMRLPDLSPAGKDQIQWAFEKTPFGLPCELQTPVASPELNGYRTKCEFTIGINLEGERTVGFLLGMFKQGQTAVQEPSQCLHVSDVAKKVAAAMEKYIRESEWNVYDRVTKEGVWRNMLVRTPRTGQVMILVQLKNETLSAEQFEAEKNKIKEFWAEFEKTEKIPVTTLLLQVWNDVSNGIIDKAETEVLAGDGFVYEELLGCRFRISYNSFFQVNTPATELLYQLCADWCKIDPSKKTILLDLCCGTGTIGITMAQSVDKVIGIEIVPEAIVDAKANAERNGISNVEYYASRVEDKLDVLTKKYDSEVVAILDPPRAGVHKSVISGIRSSNLKRLIYISCDAKQAKDNFVALCRPTSNQYPGPPFKPSRAVSVDLFPHSDACELVIEFTRDME
ncbi:tRNA (uracil(54)-C(5))-methyltransferase -B [Umbelopsis nana]